MKSGSFFDWIQAVGVVVAVLVSAYTVFQALLDGRKRDADRRVDRALDLYRDLVVEGDTARAFNELSVLLRRTGTAAAHGSSTWKVPEETDLTTGVLAPDPDPQRTTYFQDVYIVLWFFERVRINLETGIVDRDILFRTIGFHCWWWGQLLRKVESPKAAAALRYLAREVQEWATANDNDPAARQQDRMADWLPRCTDDFDGGPPVPFTGP